MQGYACRSDHDREAVSLVMEEITLRSIQHYLFCKRRWSLIHFEGQWLDNDHVVEGNLTHTLVDDPLFNEKRKDKHISRSVPVYSDRYGLHGIADCMEFVRDEAGTEILGKQGLYRINIIEYKNQKPFSDESKHAISDLMQVAAQVVCAEEMFGTSVHAYLYYAKSHRRMKVENFDEIKAELISLLAEIRHAMQCAAVFPIPEKQNCKGCSFTDICMPKSKRSASTQKRIKESIGKL